AAMHAWVLEKAKPLGQILLKQGQLDPEHLSLLEALVQAHIRAHHNDPQQSLASLSSVSSVRQELASVADDALQASLSMVGAARVADGSTGMSAQCPGEPSATIDDQTSRSAPGLRYRILRPHARGGLGEVFVALDQELRREVALKEIKAERAYDAVSRMRFL